MITLHTTCTVANLKYSTTYLDILQYAFQFLWIISDFSLEYLDKMNFWRKILLGQCMYDTYNNLTRHQFKRRRYFLKRQRLSILINTVVYSLKNENSHICMVIRWAAYHRDKHFKNWLLTPRGCIPWGDWLPAVYPGEIFTKNLINSTKSLSQNHKYFNPLVMGPGRFENLAGKSL